MLAVQSSHPRLDVVVVFVKVDQIIRVVRIRQIFTAAFPQSVYQRRAVMKFDLRVAEQLLQIDFEPQAERMVLREAWPLLASFGKLAFRHDATDLQGNVRPRETRHG
jgi:hypothetical protein